MTLLAKIFTRNLCHSRQVFTKIMSPLREAESGLPKQLHMFPFKPVLEIESLKNNEISILAKRLEDFRIQFPAYI